MGPLPDGYDETGCPVQEEVLSSRLQFCHTEDTNDETMKRSFPVDDFEFKPGNVCFAISKMRQGLPVSLSKLCDSFVHIPHSNICAGVEPLLDSPSCLTILLHVYTNWAGYTEHTFQGHKFDVVLAAPIVHNDDARKERVVTRMANELASDAIEMGDLGVALLWNPFDATASDDGDY